MIFTHTTVTISKLLVWNIIIPQDSLWYTPISFAGITSRMICKIIMAPNVANEFFLNIEWQWQ